MRRHERESSDVRAMSAWAWSSLLLAIIVVLAIALRVQHLSTVNVWFDEALGLRMAKFSVSEIVARSQRNVHPPAHFLLLHGWAIIFGGTIASLRWYALVWGLATVVGAYAVARAATSTEGCARGSGAAGLFAAFAVATSPLHVYWSQQIKMYTLGTCLAVWSAWLLLTWFQRGATWRLILYVPISAVLALLHHYGAFTVFAQLSFAVIWTSWEAWKQRGTARLWSISLTTWATTAIWALWLPSFLDQRASVVERYWIGPFSWQLAANVWPQLLGSSRSIGLPAEWSWVIVEFVIAGGILLLLSRNWELRFVSWTAMVPYGLAVAWSAALHNVLVARFLIFSQTFALVGAAILISRVPWQSGRAILAICAACAMVWLAGEQWQQRAAESRFSGTTAALSALGELRQGTEPVLVCNPMLYLCLCAHNDSGLTDLYAFDPGHGFPHFQGAPVMRDEEYLRPNQLSTIQTDWLWTLDAERWLGGNWRVPLPAGWTLQSEQRYPEFYGTLVLRAYRRDRGDSEELRHSNPSGTRP